ncbi:Ankyrin repeat and LEM domain-containing protein 2-like 1 [Homarus americanus]|uniref:Ankyrin repeat and LEM domain-containing protein 2-like 1 n=1 Tax=Homarus americanus TaxID=6706 RepID=A0A8J5JUU3_HOMAM|nr:Ankyrin repeat and LEM domain-containing protein 2-like 1 [Homarus americanus]
MAHFFPDDCNDAELNVSGLSKSSRSTMSELCQELEALRLNASLSPQRDTADPDIISASSKFLESCRPKEGKPVSGQNEVRKTEVEQEAAARQLSYIIKSVDVAAHRMAEIMGDLAKDLQSSTVANLSENRKDVKNIKTDNSIIKKLSFTEDGEDEEVIATTLIVKDGVDESQNLMIGVKNEVDYEKVGSYSRPDEENPEQDDDNDSFATAASSLEDIMVTPEEGVKVYINGLEASKLDADVLGAIGERDIDGAKYPHVFQWCHLISSYSEAQRNSWQSPYFSRVHHSSVTCSAPSKLSHPNTPTRSHTSWIPSSTPRVLFHRDNDHQDASPL